MMEGRGDVAAEPTETAHDSRACNLHPLRFPLFPFVTHLDTLIVGVML